MRSERLRAGTNAPIENQMNELPEKPKEKYLRVTMPDGSKWDIPARRIALNRAEHYGKNSAPVISVEFGFAMRNHDELIDWAANNMDWSDVKNEAINVRTPDQPDYQEGWVNGEKEVIEK